MLEVSRSGFRACGTHLTKRKQFDVSMAPKNAMIAKGTHQGSSDTAVIMGTSGWLCLDFDMRARSGLPELQYVGAVMP